MPHARKRHATELLLNKLKFAPVVAIQGPRQTGKSYLAREILKARLPGSEYVTFDRLSTKEFARTNPETFLSQFAEAKPLVIDEAQKVPQIFDAIKYEVDQRKIPGKFLILGSTEFSKLTLIRESLTGRMSRIKLYPLNAAEALELPPNPSKELSLLNRTARISRPQLMNHLERGGMPGIFATRSATERETLLRDWLELTTQRDALLFPKIKVDPELCRAILEQIARLPDPDAGNIAKALKKDLRRVKSHLAVLAGLFAIHPLSPHPASTGKVQYFLCDVSFARILGADFERQLYTWLVQEQLSQRAYRDDRESQLYFYRTPKGRRIHLVIEDGHETSAIKLFAEERVTERDMALLTGLKGKLGKKPLKLLGLASARNTFQKVELYPWESLA